MFNIGILTLKSADAVKMDITSDQKSQIELKNLDLEKQFIAAKNTKEVVFDHVTMKNTAIATINPCCQSIFIEKTTCLINFLNLKGKKMGLYVGMTAIMSLLNSATVIWTFFLKNLCLSKQVHVSNNFRSVVLCEVEGVDLFPIRVNENCQHLRIECFSVIVICPSLCKLDTLSVSFCVHNMMEIHFQEMRPITFKICYVFDSEKSICIILNSIHL